MSVREEELVTSLRSWWGAAGNDRCFFSLCRHISDEQQSGGFQIIQFNSDNRVTTLPTVQSDFHFSPLTLQSDILLCWRFSCDFVKCFVHLRSSQNSHLLPCHFKSASFVVMPRLINLFMNCLKKKEHNATKQIVRMNQ